MFWGGKCVGWLRIHLPAGFTDDHQRLILKYLIEGRAALSLVEWRLVLNGFDRLHQALVVTAEGAITFRQVYQVQVDHLFADAFIAELLQLPNVIRDYPPLRAHTARAIVTRLQQSGLRHPDSPESNLLLAYCLYFWESFAAGYAFEVAIYRDLTAAGIAFEAHDIRHQRGRLSPYDLRVLGLRGDIKTSLYFLYVGRGRGLPHDFYLTRFYEADRQRTLVVILKPEAWTKIDGDTIVKTLEQALSAFPKAALVELESAKIVVVDYAVWKTKVLHRQHREEIKDEREIDH
jgi:hypothetical protein